MGAAPVAPPPQLLAPGLLGLVPTGRLCGSRTVPGSSGRPGAWAVAAASAARAPSSQGPRRPPDGTPRRRRPRRSKYAKYAPRYPCPRALRLGRTGLRSGDPRGGAPDYAFTKYVCVRFDDEETQSIPFDVSFDAAS
eukprot:1067703-Prymnesium_polylepis.1